MRSQFRQKRIAISEKKDWSLPKSNQKICQFPANRAAPPLRLLRFIHGDDAIFAIARSCSWHRRHPEREAGDPVVQNFMRPQQPVPSARRQRTMRRRLRNLSGNRCGIAAVEFALVMPILSFMVVGVLSFGSALNNYVELTEGVRVATRVLAQSSAYPSLAYSSAFSSSGYFDNATKYLTPSDLSWTVSVAGTQCNTTTSSYTSADNTACNSALSSATAGAAVTVTATYSLCVTVMTHNFLPGCVLTVSTTQMVD
jgi:Flp pilus assembly protein TadG